MADNLVEPLAGAPAPAPEVTPTAEAVPESSGGFSDELLQIPAMQALFAGQPAALSAPIEEFATRPEAKALMDHKAELQKAGMLLYRSLDGSTGVIYNALKVHGSDIQAADKAGQLQQIAPPFDAINQSVGSSGQANPVLSAQDPTGAAMATAPAVSTAPPMPSPVSQTPSSSQKKITAARMKNAAAGSPTSGPAPGAGRLLNQILKPVL